MADQQVIPRVLIASNTFESEADAYRPLLACDCEIVTIPAEVRAEWTEANVIEAIQGFDGAIFGGDHELGAAVFQAADRLKFVSLNCTGYNHIDLKAASAKGIAVCNAPGFSYNAVADLIFGQILALMRQIVKADKAIRAGKWVEGVEKSAAVSEKTIGIIGMGSIGQAVAKRATGFDMNIIAHVRTQRPEVAARYGLTYVTKDELLEQADIVVICSPLTAETYHTIGDREFARMKPTSYLINSSRGAIVDEEALYEALASKRIAGAALDVFKQEPLLASRFFALDNVVLTPHIGGLADKQIFLCAEAAAKHMASLLKGDLPPTVLNPEVLQK